MGDLCSGNILLATNLTVSLANASRHQEREREREKERKKERENVRHGGNNDRWSEETYNIRDDV